MLYTTLVHALPLLVEKVSAENAAPRLSNLLISNPFGFAGEPYLMGAAGRAGAAGVGGRSRTQAQRHRGHARAERLQIGFLAMPEAVPHIEQLARLTEQAFDEVKAALGAARRRPRPAAAHRQEAGRHARRAAQSAAHGA